MPLRFSHPMFNVFLGIFDVRAVEFGYFMPVLYFVSLSCPHGGREGGGGSRTYTAIDKREKEARVKRKCSKG